MKSQAHVLIVGRDEMLLQTRKLILGTFFQVETAGRLSHAAGMVADRTYDLIVLCYSLTDEECQKVVDLVQHQSPRPQILAMNTLGRPSAGAGAHQELRAEDGPYALVKKAAQMLGVELKGTGRGSQASVRRTPTVEV